MKVYAEAAQRLLDEHDEVPGYEGVRAEVVDIDDNGVGELRLKGNPHAEVGGFANAAGIVATSAPAPEVNCVKEPEIQGIPAVGQWLTLDPGVWDFDKAVEHDPSGERTALLSQSGGWQAVEPNWIYTDGELEDEWVVCPEESPQGKLELLIPPAALGRTIAVKMHVGSTIHRTAPVGPVVDGLTEATLIRGGATDDVVISAEPGALRGKAGEHLSTPISGDSIANTDPGAAGDVTDPPPLAPRRHV